MPNKQPKEVSRSTVIRSSAPKTYADILNAADANPPFKSADVLAVEALQQQPNPSASGVSRESSITPPKAKAATLEEIPFWTPEYDKVSALFHAAAAPCSIITKLEWVRSSDLKDRYAAAKQAAAGAAVARERYLFYGASRVGAAAGVGVGGPQRMFLALALVVSDEAAAGPAAGGYPAPAQAAGAGGGAGAGRVTAQYPVYLITFEEFSP
jgi:hypothetical protein